MTLKVEKGETLLGFAVKPRGCGWKRFDLHVHHRDHVKPSQEWQPLPVAPASRDGGERKEHPYGPPFFEHVSHIHQMLQASHWSDDGFKPRRCRRLSLWSLQVNYRLGQTSGLFFPGSVFISPEPAALLATLTSLLLLALTRDTDKGLGYKMAD